MLAIRAGEQRRAAVMGGYSAVAQLGFDSGALDSDAARVEAVLTELIEIARPEIVYVHSPFDRHPTHVAACLRAIAALRAATAGATPARVLGVEVWGSLDWLPHRVALDVSDRPQLRDALLGVYGSQIRGGKPLPDAQAARALANAIFDSPELPPPDARPDGVTFAVDLTTLVREAGGSVSDFVEEQLGTFTSETIARLVR